MNVVCPDGHIGPLVNVAEVRCSNEDCPVGEFKWVMFHEQIRVDLPFACPAMCMTGQAYCGRCDQPMLIAYEPVR